MAERKAEFDVGQYAKGSGPGDGGMWFVRRKVEEVIGYGKTRGEAEEIAAAFRAKEAGSSVRQGE